MKRFDFKTSDVQLSKVERITKGYDEQGRVAWEEWEHYYPVESREQQIGFRSKKK